MFICSVRFSTLKFFGVLLLTLVLLVALLATGGAAALVNASGEVNFGGIRTNADRIAFFSQFGVRVEEVPAEEKSFVMPKDFDRVILGYNELQKKQGLDLSKYAKKKVTRYTYRVENVDEVKAAYAIEEEDVTALYADLLVYRTKIVACDIASADPVGTVRPLVK